MDMMQAFVEGIESKDGEEPSLKWAHIDIAGTMEVGRYFGRDWCSS